MISNEIRLTENAPSEGLIEATVPGNPRQKIYNHSEAHAEDGGEGTCPTGRVTAVAR